MMNEKQEAALRLAREAILQIAGAMPFPVGQKAIAAIDEALMSVSDGAHAPEVWEQPAQVDPCIDGSCSCCWTHLDEQPAQPSKPWAGLTNDEIALLNADYPHPQGFARALEAKLRELNEHREKNA